MMHKMNIWLCNIFRKSAQPMMRNKKCSLTWMVQEKSLWSSVCVNVYTETRYAVLHECIEKNWKQFFDWDFLNIHWWECLLYSGYIFLGLKCYSLLIAPEPWSFDLKARAMRPMMHWTKIEENKPALVFGRSSIFWSPFFCYFVIRYHLALSDETGSQEHFQDQNGLEPVSRPFWVQSVTLPRVARLVSRPFSRPKWSRDRYRHQNVTL